MRYVVCYDVTEDDTRLNVAHTCKEFGLERIQYSVFMGELNDTQRKELERKLEDLIKEANASIYFIPQCASCLGKLSQLMNIIPSKDKNKTEVKLQPIVKFDDEETEVIIL